MSDRDLHRGPESRRELDFVARQINVSDGVSQVGSDRFAMSSRGRLDVGPPMRSKVAAHRFE
jgi:hypothetical protein